MTKLKDWLLKNSAIRFTVKGDTAEFHVGWLWIIGAVILTWWLA